MMIDAPFTVAIGMTCTIALTRVTRRRRPTHPLRLRNLDAARLAGPVHLFVSQTQATVANRRQLISSDCAWERFRRPLMKTAGRKRPAVVEVKDWLSVSYCCAIKTAPNITQSAKSGQSEASTSQTEEGVVSIVHTPSKGRTTRTSETHICTLCAL